MRQPLLPVIAGLATLVLAACAAGTGTNVVPQDQARYVQTGRALPAQSPTPSPAPTAAPGGLLGGLIGGLLGGVLNTLCSATSTSANCGVQQNTKYPATKTYSAGITANDIAAAYALPAASGAVPNGPVVAIVDAYDTPNAEADLRVYRAAFGLPACTTANGCFKRVAPAGSGGLLGTGLLASTSQNASWNAETMLDLEMASAACPSCRLMLVESANNDIAALAAAVVTAASYKPGAISNSFGIPESSETASLAAKWYHPGIPIAASAGDAGKPTFPATSKDVIAVGGTFLAKLPGTPRGWVEAPWVATGAGCSANDARPSWQTDSYGCTTRAVADVSAVAAANPGIAMYDSVSGGWIVVAGTSASAPIVAALFAQAHDYPSGATGAASVYARASALNELPGGRYTQGTPNGLGAF